MNLTDRFSFYLHNDWSNPFNSFFQFRFINLGFEIDRYFGKAVFDLSILGASMSFSFVFDSEAAEEMTFSLNGMVKDIDEAIAAGDMSKFKVFVSLSADEYNDFKKWKDECSEGEG